MNKNENHIIPGQKKLKIYCLISYLQDLEGRTLKEIPTTSLLNKIITAQAFLCNRLVIEIHTPTQIKGGEGTELYAMCDGSYALSMGRKVSAHAMEKGSSANAMVPGAIAIAEVEGSDAYAQAEYSDAYARAEKALAVAYCSGSSAYGEADGSIIRAEGLFRCTLYVSAERVQVENRSDDGEIIYTKK